MAEEDLIFGKNRHLFGGIEPSNMITFSATRTDDSVILINAVLPEDTIVEGQTLCSVAGAVIRRKTTGYPSDEFDGELVADIPRSRNFEDKEVDSDKNYYYSAFPYTTQGVYNRNKQNRTLVRSNESTTFLFGYDLNPLTADPSSRVTYPSAVDNFKYSPACMDFVKGVMNYGDWVGPAVDLLLPKPCMLTYEGEVHSYLDPNDYSKNIDGTPSEVSNPHFEGNAMMEWPKIYIKRYEEGQNIYKFRCSNVKIDDDYECWCNYDRLDNEIDHFYTPIYFGSVIDGKLRSISGQKHNIGYSMQEQVDMASANGPDWYIETVADRMLINDLLVMLAKSTDGQKSYGNGFFSDGPTKGGAREDSGTMDDKGLFWGLGYDGVKIFGMEHWWGNIYRRIAGWMSRRIQVGSKKWATTSWVKITRGMKDGSKVDDYRTDEDKVTGYIEIGPSLDGETWPGEITGTSGGYISKTLQVNKPNSRVLGRFPIEASGSSSTYECDTLYYHTQKTNKIEHACVGGCWLYSSGNGPFSAHLALSIGGSTFVESVIQGAALSCKPVAKI